MQARNEIGSGDDRASQPADASCRARGSRKVVNQTQWASARTIARQNYSSAIGIESLRRRGSEVMPSSRTSSVGGRLFDASSLLVHAPRKILIPHSTTTMADTSVAAVNTLSKEATLILLSASQPH